MAGSDSALNRARGPNVSGADQCCALLSGLPRTSKLKKKNELKKKKTFLLDYYENQLTGSIKLNCKWRKWSK